MSDSEKSKTENQDATPYDDPIYKKEPGSVKPGLTPSGGLGSTSGEASESSTSGSGGGSSVSITTRARFTYELDRYEKNAMLIVLLHPEEKGKLRRVRCSEQYYTAYRIKKTFKRFRFEITQRDNLMSNELDMACTNFFQRDFTSYGVVAVVVITAFNIEDLTEGMSIDTPFDESIILRHFSLERNPTLHSKPKLLFTEVCGQTGHMTEPLPSSYQIEYSDVLRVHVPKINNLEYGRFHTPMVELCMNIQRRANRHDLLSIVMDTVTRIDDPHYADNVISTLQREVYLATNPSELD